MVRMALMAGLFCGLGLGTLTAVAGPAPGKARVAPAEVSAQARPSTRLRVYPGRRLLYRDCDFRLVRQYRPAGAVIVPWQRCWWVRG